MNLYKLHNGDLINLEHLCEIRKMEGYRGSPECQVMGVFVGGSTTVIAGFKSVEEAQAAIDSFQETQEWPSLTPSE